MSKKVLILSTSLRSGSNSHALAEGFAKGAQESGHTVERISLMGKDIHFCCGCLACQKTNRCVIHEDADVFAIQGSQAMMMAYEAGKAIR